MKLSFRSAVHFTGRSSVRASQRRRPLPRRRRSSTRSRRRRRRDDAEPVLGEPEHERAHDQAVHVRVLRRHPQRQLVGRARVGRERGAWLDGHGMSRWFTSRCLTTCAAPASAASVAAASPICQRKQTLSVPSSRTIGAPRPAPARRPPRPERLVVHRHEPGGIARGGAGLGDDHRHCFAHVMHLLDGIAWWLLGLSPGRSHLPGCRSRRRPRGPSRVDGYDARDASERHPGRCRGCVRGRVDSARTPRGGFPRPGRRRCRSRGREEPRIFLPTHAGTEDPLDAVCCVSACGALVAGGGRCGRGHGRRSSAWFAAGYLDLGAGR
jgi:hypothetical protein